MHDLELPLLIDRFLAARPYYPCCLFVHPDVQRLQQISLRLAESFSWPILSLGSVLSERLLHVTPVRRTSEVSTIFKDIVQGYLADLVICSDIDMLFDPTLRLDPLRLLRDTSRLRALVAMWPGSFTSGTLVYATPEHAHHRVWSRPELCDHCVVTL